MHRWGKLVFNEYGTQTLALCEKCGAHKLATKKLVRLKDKRRTPWIWITVYKVPKSRQRFKHAPPCDPAASSRDMERILNNGAKEHRSDGKPRTVLGLPAQSNEGVHLEIEDDPIEGRMHLVVFNEGGYNATTVDLAEVLGWMQANVPIALLRLMASLKKHEGESKDFVRRNAMPFPEVMEELRSMDATRERMVLDDITTNDPNAREKLEPWLKEPISTPDDVHTATTVKMRTYPPAETTTPGSGEEKK